MLFAGSEAGHNILGRKAALMRYDGDAIRAFTGRAHDRPDGLLFDRQLLGQDGRTVAARYFAQQAATTRGFVRAATAPRPPFEKTVVKHTHQTHHHRRPRVRIGEEKRPPLALVTNILGGPCANSLLNVVVREKTDCRTTSKASYTPYSDTGIVAIYFSSETRQRRSAST